MIMLNLCIFCTFSTFVKKSLRDEAEISKEALKVMR